MGYSLAKIADELNISKTTVSFVLNGKGDEKRVSRDMQENILNFCQKVNYTVNIHAKRMNSERSNTIGILLYPGKERNLPNPLSDENTANILGGIMNAAKKHNYRFLVDVVDPESSADKITASFKSKEIDGLIYYGFNMPEAWLKKFKKEKYNMVGIGIDPALGIPSVNTDNYNASFQLTETLLEKGYKSFRYLHGTGRSYQGNERYRGFKDALQKAGIEYKDNENDYAHFRTEFAEEWARKELENKSLMERVIFCENDNMAIGVLTELKKNGIKVPEEKAVVGADNTSIAQYAGLTTYRSLTIDQGAKAFELLFDIIKGTKKENRDIVLKTELQIRDSA
jgi:LacI family transcriptional regulator